MKVKQGLQKHPLVRYGISICITVAAFLSYQVLLELVGGNLPTYITFYPAVIIAALLAGFGAGLLATATAALFVVYWILPPEGLAVSAFTDAVSLAIFSFNSMLISVVAELYRRSRQRAAAYEKERALLDERKKADEVLRESERNLKRAQEIAHLGSWQFDLVNNRLSWSDEVYRIFGLQPQEFGATYEAFLEAVHPDDRAAVDDAYSGSLREGRDTYEIEHRIVRKSDGGVRIVHEKCEHIRDESGRIIRSAGMVHDITERKRIEEAIRQSQQVLKRMFASLRDAIFIIDAETVKITTCNPAASEVFGYGIQEMLGRTTGFLHVDAAALTEFRRRLNSAVEEKGFLFLPEFAMKRKDGIVFPTEHSVMPIEDEEGKRIGWVSVVRDITERKQVEEKLKKTEEKYRSIFENAVEGIFQTTPEGRLMSVNPAIARMFGYDSPEDMISLVVNIGRQLYVNPEHRKEHLRLLNEKGVVEDYEARMYRKDGSIFWISMNTRAVRNDAGNPIYYEGLAIDVTKRKLAEKALKESEEKFRLIADTMHQLVWTAGPDGKVDYVNSFYEKYTGLNPDTASRMFDLIHPDDVKRCEEAWHHSARTGDIYDVENRARRHDGEYRWFLTRGVPVRDEKGNILKWYGTATDIHDLRELQGELETKVIERTEQLRQSEETYRLLFELNLAGVFRVAVDPTTMKGIRIDCNDAHARILGYSSREELLNIDVAKVFPSENAWKTYVRTIMKKKELINYENQLVRRDGSRIWVVLNVSIRKIDADDNTKLLIEGTMVDITDRKKAEEQMRAVHRKLRAMASEMVRTEERERQHIATVLHDTVAQTLAAVKMKCESVQEHITSDDLKPMAEARNLIAESIKQTRSIMAELSPPVLNEIGFIPALEWLTEQFTNQHGIPIQFDSIDVFQHLPHDIEVLLYQSTRELLMNVVKHAKAKSATVTVSRSSSKVQITVSDNGIGMDKAKMGYRGDLSGGFGLFSIRERLKHFDGHLDIQSKLGEGTRITMTTPWKGL